MHTNNHHHPNDLLRELGFGSFNINTRFMVDQLSFFLEVLTQVYNNTFLFQQHFKAACDILPLIVRACFLLFEQLIGQEMF